MSKRFLGAVLGILVAGSLTKISDAFVTTEYNKMRFMPGPNLSSTGKTSTFGAGDNALEFQWSCHNWIRQQNFPETSNGEIDSCNILSHSGQGYTGTPNCGDVANQHCSEWPVRYGISYHCANTYKGANKTWPFSHYLGVKLTGTLGGSAVADPQQSTLGPDNPDSFDIISCSHSDNSTVHTNDVGNYDIFLSLLISHNSHQVTQTARTWNTNEEDTDNVSETDPSS